MMSHSKLYRVKKEKSQNTLYIFFCEGRSESNFLEYLKRIINNNDVKFATYQMPKLKESTDAPRIFRPTYIYDFYRYKYKIIKEEEFPLCYNVDVQKNQYVEEHNRKVDNEIYKNADNWPVIIIDSDVFFTTRPDQYVNTNRNEKDFRNTLYQYRKHAEITQDKKDNKYLFIEQELCFEDFFVLLVSDDNVFESWFRNRFGEKRPNTRYDGYERDKNAPYSPDRLRGQLLKQRFNTDIIGFRKNIINNPDKHVYAEAEKAISKQIDKYITETKTQDILNRLNTRIDDNRRNGWPFRFGMNYFIQKLQS